LGFGVLISVKNWVSFEDYDYNMYPPFIPGPGKLLDYKAVSEVYYGSQFVKHLHLEDVYQAIVAAKLGIVQIHDRKSKLKIVHGFKCNAQILDYWKKRNMKGLVKCPKKLSRFRVHT